MPGSAQEVPFGLPPAGSGVMGMTVYGGGSLAVARGPAGSCTALHALRSRPPSACRAGPRAGGRPEARRGELPPASSVTRSCLLCISKKRLKPHSISQRQQRVEAMDNAAVDQSAKSRTERKPEGWIQGWPKGGAKEEIATARRALAHGSPMATASRRTDLPVHVVRKLAVPGTVESDWAESWAKGRAREKISTALRAGPGAALPR